MAQPPAYNRLVSFTNLESADPSGQPPGSDLDGEFNLIKQTLDAVLTNLALIQRDDGKLLDATVQTHTLSSDVLTLMASTTFTVRGAWVGGTAYSKGDVVLQGGIVYVCFVAHTAGVFATDLAAGDWGSLTTSSNAATTSFSPTATIAAVTVQAAIAELDNEVRPNGSLLNRILFNGL